MLQRCLILLLLILVTTHVRAGDASTGDAVQYNRDIRPILSNACFSCHGPDEKTREADLRLDVAKAAFAKRDSSSAIVPGKPEASQIIARMISADVDEQMPPPNSHLKVTKKQINLIRQWIQQGAKYQPHWAFRPIKSFAIPQVEQKGWIHNGIDSFVLHRLEKANIKPSPVATRETLIRRLSLDLIGLPPSPEEVKMFVDNQSPHAYEQLVDRLLASPHYGERWGRHWLDQARYADTNGYTIDSPRSIWLYRDWVIDALNKDMPFDQFTIEQIAGDLLPKPTRSQLIATGFHRNTLINQEGGTDKEQFRNEAVVDRVNTTGAVWLGLTVGCAQCHNHKFDPVSQTEFYQLFAFYNSGSDINSTSPTLLNFNPAQQKELGKFNKQIAQAKKALAEYDKQHKATPTKKNIKAEAQSKKKPVKKDPVREKLEAKVKSIEKLKSHLVKKIPTTMIMRELKKPRTTHVHIRGDFLRKGDVVQPNVPAALSALSPKKEEKLNRLQLAAWLVSKNNPLTPRVTVNRIWGHYFGRGIVQTENDFGLQGTLPTHPELLDWLSAQFINNGWSMKKMHKLIVTSATYQQSSSFRNDLKEVDPKNYLLAKQSRIRVDAEIVRDICLKASGLLSSKIGGKSVYPPQPAGVYSFTQNKMKWVTSKGEDRYRRGMYTFFRRSAPYPMLTTFDTPRFNSTCTKRVSSNTPLQSLTIANDETMQEFAQALGRRVLLQKEMNIQQKIDYAFRLCMARTPNQNETNFLSTYLQNQKTDFKTTPGEAKKVAGANLPKTISPINAAAWTSLARVLLNLDETITRE